MDEYMEHEGGSGCIDSWGRGEGVYLVDPVPVQCQCSDRAVPAALDVQIAAAPGGLVV